MSATSEASFSVETTSSQPFGVAGVPAPLNPPKSVPLHLGSSALSRGHLSIFTLLVVVTGEEGMVIRGATTYPTIITSTVIPQSKCQGAEVGRLCFS